MVKRLLWLLMIIVVVALYLRLADETPIVNEDPRFQKIAHDGSPLSSWQGPWACVFDKQQKLLWEVKRDDESIHDGYWTYSWFDGVRGVENMGDCYFESDRCDTLDLIQQVNQQGLCGLTQWRLPTQKELQALLVNNDRPNENQIAIDYFPQLQRGDFWTSTHSQPLITRYRDINEGAAVVNFQQRSSQVLPYRNAAFVILVNDNINLVNFQ